MKRQLLIPAGLFIIAIFIIQIRYDHHLLTIHTVIFDAQSKQSNTRRFEPFVNRWRHKFDDRDRDGYLFFKHIRKAGGTTMRNYLAQALKYHDNPRSVADFIHNVNPEHINDQLFVDLKKVNNLGQDELDLINSTILTANLTHAVRDGDRKHQVHYAEQEFSAMDWQCSQVDPRWNSTLSVIMLRHPIERHLSEFFYSGPGSSLGLDAKKLFGDKNSQYKKRVRKKLVEELPNWLNETGGDKRSTNWYLGRYYTDNFQLRALAGCSYGDCMEQKNLTIDENTTILQGIEDSLNISYTKPNGACTMYFSEKVKIIEPCRSYSRSSKGKFKQLCPKGCDSPCRYPVAAWGPVEYADLSRAIQALESYDAIFLTETLDNDDQSAFLADIMGVPRNASFSLRSKNTNTKKSSEREKTHFYRDLLLNLTLDGLYERIHKENALELEFFDYAVDLNRQMIEQWKEESVQ